MNHHHSNNHAVLVLGGTSSIGRAIAAGLAKKGHPIYLASRDETDLKRFAADLEVRYRVDVKYGIFDAEDFRGHKLFLEQVVHDMDGLYGVVAAFGTLGDQSKALRDFTETQKIFNLNLIGACSILTHCANYLEKKKEGFIIGISSIAGERGKQSNYIYGASKAGFTVFLEGLRNRLYPSHVHVMTVKPGFIDTAMNFGKQGLFGVVSPQYLGEKVVKSLSRKSNEIYVPWFWRSIMWSMSCIPENIFKKLKF